MTKTIKICDKCGKECDWLYRMPIMNVKGYKIELSDNIPSGKAMNEFCESCTRDFICRYNDMILHHLSF